VATLKIYKRRYYRPINWPVVVEYGCILGMVIVIVAWALTK